MNQKLPVIAVNKAAPILSAGKLKCRSEFAEISAFCDYLPLMVKAARNSPKKGVSVGAANPPDPVAIRLDPGFSEKAFAAVDAWLRIAGSTPIVVGESVGWVRGREGYPVRVETGDAGDVPSVTIAPNGVRASPPASGKLPGNANEMLSRIVDGETPTGPYHAAIAVSEGFDGRATVAMMAWLAVKGMKLIVVGAKPGKVRGLNGIVLDAKEGFDEVTDLAGDAVIVCPGVTWPKSDAEAQRKEWVKKRYADGASVVTFGFDAYEIARPCCKARGVGSDQYDKGRGGPAQIHERCVSIRNADHIAAGIAHLETLREKEPKR